MTCIFSPKLQHGMFSKLRLFLFEQKGTIMKRIIIFTLLIISFCFNLSAISMQKTFSTDSVEYQMAYALCVAGGVVPPSSVNPITGEEILSALQRIPENNLSFEEKAMLEELVSALGWNQIVETDYFGMDPRAIISLDAFVQTDIPENDRDFFIDYGERLHPLDLSLDFNFADYGYGFVDYVFASPTLRENYNQYFFGTNLDALYRGSFGSLLQLDGALHAGILFGNKWMNISIMSAPQSMGYGRTGNLGLGDNFDHQRFLRFHTFSRYFDYTFNLTHYASMSNNSSINPDDLHVIQGELFNGKQQEYIIHRLEFKLLDKIQLTMMETSMFYVDNPFDIRIFNPFLFLHGFNNYVDSTEPNNPDEPGSKDEANNLMVLEFSYTFLPHHRLNLQVLIDQIQFSSEPGGSPSGLGFLLNYETSWFIDKGYLTGWFEMAYMMPAVYLNHKLGSDEDYNHNFDFIVGSQFYSLNSNGGQINYTGYGYGPDSIVIGMGASYGKLNHFKIDGSLIYSIHGMYGLGYETIIPAGRYDGNDWFSVPFSKAEHRIEIAIKGSYIPVDGLKLQGGIAFVQAWNYQCSYGKNLSDLQLYIGVSFDPVEMFAK